MKMKCPKKMFDNLVSYIRGFRSPSIELYSAQGASYFSILQRMTGAFVYLGLLVFFILKHKFEFSFDYEPITLITLGLCSVILLLSGCAACYHIFMGLKMLLVEYLLGPTKFGRFKIGLRMHYFLSYIAYFLALFLIWYLFNY